MFLRGSLSESRITSGPAMLRKINLRDCVPLMVNVIRERGEKRDGADGTKRERGVAMLLLLLALPFCLIPVPGLSTPFGIAVLLIGIRIAFRQKP